MAKTTIKDLARYSGWSLGTVSRVLNNEPNVSKKARTEVLAAVEALHYKPDQNARNLRARHENRIDLIVGKMSAWYPKIATQLAQILEKEMEGYRIRICPVMNPKQEQEYLESVQNRPALMVFMGVRFKLISELLGRMECPAICAGEEIPYEYAGRISSYSSMETEPAQQAVEFLFENGCSSIGVIGQPRNDNPCMQARMLGVQYAFYSRDQVFNQKKQSVEAEDTLQDGYAAFVRLHEKMPDLDGLFVMGSLQAAGALRAIADQMPKSRKPAIICMDDLEITRYTLPRITSFSRKSETELSDLLAMIHAALKPEEAVSWPVHQQAAWSFQSHETLNACALQPMQDEQ